MDTFPHNALNCFAALIQKEKKKRVKFTAADEDALMPTLEKEINLHRLIKTYCCESNIIRLTCKATN